MNEYAQLKLHSLEMEKRNRMEVRCSPVTLTRGAFHRFIHRLSGGGSCACTV